MKLGKPSKTNTLNPSLIYNFVWLVNFLILVFLLNFSWRCFYYSLMFGYGMAVLWGKPWLWDIRYCCDQDFEKRHWQTKGSWQQQWEQQLQGVRFQLLLRPLVTQRSSCTCCIVLSRLLLMIMKIKFKHVIFL